jgi:uncharacterized membrane protein
VNKGTELESRNGSTHSRNHNVGNLERSVSAIAGVVLAAYGLKQRSWKGVAVASFGGALVYRGASGVCQVYDLFGVNTSKENEVAREVHTQKAITVGRPAAELYHFWRDFRNLKTFMLGVESVEIIDDQHSHWTVNAMGRTYQWDAEIFNEKENELIAWRSVGAADIVNAGAVRFQPLEGDRGTCVFITLNFNPPGGKVTAAILKLIGDQPGRLLERNLQRFKQLMETGEIATIEGQPSGREPSAHPIESPAEEISAPSRAHSQAA